jgi:hypothetical protein
MLRTAFLDYRESIYKSLGDLVKTPRGALAFLSEYTDRTEGKAKQVIENNVRRVTTFAPSAPARSQSGTDADVAAHRDGPDGERMIQL